MRIVGISQKIKRAWLDAVLDELIRTTDERELRTFLDTHLAEELPGKESRAKRSGIILHIWSSIPPELSDIRDRAVALLPRISGQERIWLHWGMTALAYPFFRDVAEVIGRLLTLQDDLTTAQVQARIVTTWGDRATSREAVQKLITSLADWEVLRSTKTKGHFLLARKMTTADYDLQLWLLEALLRASATDEIEAQQLLRLPESFPFTLTATMGDLRKHEWFNIHRQGLDMDMVTLRKVKVEQLAKPSAKQEIPKKTEAAEPVQPTFFYEEPEKIGSSTDKIAEVPVISVTGVDEKQNDADQQRRIEDAIKNEVLRTLSDRAARFLQVRTMKLGPDTPFAAPSAECAEAFRDGHYFGCIALTQALLEAVVQQIYHSKITEGANHDGSFQEHLNALHQRKFISRARKTKLEQMWADRHSFHKLRPSIASDQEELQQRARKSLKLLQKLQEEFFSARR
ncbi:MAG: hypothetical protein ACRD7E_03095 [Bryobacteraceae bacterium]